MATFGPHEKIGFTISERLHYDKLIAKVGAIDSELKQFVATKIADPVVLLTGWSPISRSGSNLHSYELVPMTTGRFEFHATSYFKGWGTGFIVMGLAVALLVSIQNYSRGRFFSGQTAMVFLVAAAFAGAGWYMRFRMTLPAAFDIDEGLFWKQAKARPEGNGNEGRKDITSLDDVHALQIVPGYHSGDQGSSGYYSYELNLVLKDGQRVGVVSSGDRYNLSRDVTRLAEFIDKPVWDATEFVFDFYAAHQMTGR